MPMRPQIMKPIVYPTKCNVQHYCHKHIVPHIHPSHTTHVNHELYEHLHYYPHTESVVNEISNQHFNCPGPMPGMFGPRPRPFFRR